MTTQRGSLLIGHSAPGPAPRYTVTDSVGVFSTRQAPFEHLCDAREYASECERLTGGRPGRFIVQTMKARN